jgi:hypothetical protein
MMILLTMMRHPLVRGVICFLAGATWIAWSTSSGVRLLTGIGIGLVAYAAIENWVNHHDGPPPRRRRG